MSKTRAILGTLASVALATAGCTTVYTQADVERLEKKRDAEEAIASEEPPVTGPSLNEELVDEQARWVEIESDR